MPSPIIFINIVLFAYSIKGVFAIEHIYGTVVSGCTCLGSEAMNPGDPTDKEG